MKIITTHITLLNGLSCFANLIDFFPEKKAPVAKPVGKYKSLIRRLLLG